MWQARRRYLLCRLRFIFDHLYEVPKKPLFVFEVQVQRAFSKYYQYTSYTMMGAVAEAI